MNQIAKSIPDKLAEELTIKKTIELIPIIKEGAVNLEKCRDIDNAKKYGFRCSKEFLKVLNRLDLDICHRMAFAESEEYVDKDGFVVDIRTEDAKPLAVKNKNIIVDEDLFLEKAKDYDYVISAYDKYKDLENKIICERLSTEASGFPSKRRKEMAVCVKKNSIKLLYKIEKRNEMFVIHNKIETTNRESFLFLIPKSNE